MNKMALSTQLTEIKHLILSQGFLPLCYANHSSKCYHSQNIDEISNFLSLLKMVEVCEKEVWDRQRKRKKERKKEKYNDEKEREFERTKY